MSLASNDAGNPRYYCDQYRQHSVLEFVLNTVDSCSFFFHQDMVRGIAPHPYQDEVFLSARRAKCCNRASSSLLIRLCPFNSSDDGRILLHDSRAKNRLTSAQSTLQNNTEFTDVRSHPLVEHLFATSDSHGAVCLRDSRMAFGPLVNRTREGIVRVVSMQSLTLRSGKDTCFSTTQNYQKGALAISATPNQAALRLIDKVCLNYIRYDYSSSGTPQEPD